MISLQDAYETVGEVIELRNKKKAWASKGEEVLNDACKISEEVGELMSELGKAYGYARAGKVADRKKMEAELADVVMSCCVLAITAGIDLDGAISDKIQVLKERIASNQFS